MEVPRRPDANSQFIQMREEIQNLKIERQLQGDEVRALKAQAKSYQDELQTLKEKLRLMKAEQELQEKAITTDIIGREVRLRYLEQHRKRMGKSIGDLGYYRIKAGDRAAHRGRPVVDASLCLAGLMTDKDVFPDLYGVSPKTMKKWRDVPEIVEVTGFHASLQSEGRTTAQFRTHFHQLLEVARTYCSSIDLRAGFKEDTKLQRLLGELQNCYDAIIAARPGRQGVSSS